METNEYLDEIDKLWPEPGKPPSRELVDFCVQAIAEHPESSTLWYDFGILMQRCGDDYAYEADDYLRCFEKSAKCNPNNAEAYRELGYVLDVYYSDYERADRAFKRAIELGADHESYLGRARVLAQLKKNDDAIHSLSENACPFHDHPEIQKLRSEIVDGIWSRGRKRGHH
jgi:tetratricopeptide (TPR) repeat protein